MASREVLDSPAMRQAKVDLAACYRAVARYGMTDLIYNHITLRAPGRPDWMLINSYGLLYEEVCASNLCVIDEQGDLIDGPRGAVVNAVGYVIHSAVHEARPDVNCVIHTHSRAGVAVSAMKGGLEPLTQTAMFVCGGLSYHDYHGPAHGAEEKRRLQQDLGQNNLMILRNHGLLACGVTVGEAFLNLYNLENACKAHVDIAAARVPVSGCEVEIVQRSWDAVTEIREQIGGGGPLAGARLEWDAILRQLDRADSSFRA